jgi:outer membrane protein TolC
MRIKRSTAWLLAALLAVNGCAVGPDYQAMPHTAPVAWQATTTESDNTLLTSEMSDDAQALARWWTWFEDDSLTALIEMALAQNFDVRAAEVRVQAARRA